MDTRYSFRDGDGSSQRALVLWAFAWTAIIIGLVAAGCSRDVFDVTVDLHTQTYRADFGTAAGTIPAVSCDPATPATCEQGTGCDAATSRCFVQASGRVPYAVDVFQDDGFTSKIASHVVEFVRVADVAYAVSMNSLTFDVPQIDIYVGPAGITRETDPGVVPVGSTPPLAAGALLDNGHLTVDDASPARATIEDDIRNERPLTFLLVLSPQIEAGAAVPAGALQVDVSPTLLIGLPR